MSALTSAETSLAIGLRERDFQHHLAGWRSRMATRQGLPVFMSHGRADNILPYDLAERLHADLVAAGLVVTFVPFDGGHEIPEEVVVALGAFLAQTSR
jgi:phospholipase/carboxylesterase